ncbi:MAG: enoyl-CoA hydratase/isomerase family protein [Candidatus Lokiarchaeota archaeon]|nr:enoyl-CoA hydratase/isomerase family protein [Candidatus Lokiarchaeota archaeon]
MDYEQIIFETSEKIATITLNRPERLNAWTWQMSMEIWDALMKVENDPNLRVTIMTGAGRGFCAGADLSRGATTFDGTERPREEQQQRARAQGGAIKRYFSLKKPVIVAINGPTVGVGVTFILPFDIRIASESARIGIVFNRRGVIPEIACPWLLPRIVGVSRAAELMYTGRILNAQESLEFGLVSRVVPDDKLMDVAREIADEILLCAPVSVALTKTMLYQFLTETDVNKAELINHRYFTWTGLQPDAREGVVSFLQKRRPEWKLKVPGDLPEFYPLE